MIDSINIGPFAVPMTLLVFMLGIVTATYLGKRVAGSNGIYIDSVLWKGLLVGFITSRLVYVGSNNEVDPAALA